MYQPNPVSQDPADIGSRGSLIGNISRVWWEGPSWLPDNTKWPHQPFITSTTEYEKETKCIKELLTTAVKVIRNQNIIICYQSTSYIKL